MRNRYNFYHDMLRAAAGDPPSGGATEVVVIDDGSDTSNGNTINADDPDEPEVVVKKDDEEEPPAVVKKDGEEDPPAKPSVVPRDAMLKRVGELTRDKTSLKTENERLKAELAAKAAAPSTDDEPDPSRAEFKTKAEFDAAVEAVAEKKAQDKRAADQKLLDNQQFTKRCNAVADIGEKDFKDDWNESVANLRMLSDDGNIPKLLLDAALEADLPAQALHFLGQNPDKAMEIMALPPLKQVVEITKLGIKKAGPAPKPKTNAPDPIEPLNGRGSADSDAGLGDEVDDATWLANRTAEVRANALAAAKR